MSTAHLEFETECEITIYFSHLNTFYLKMRIF